MNTPVKRSTQRRGSRKISEQRTTKRRAAAPPAVQEIDTVLDAMLLALEPVELAPQRKLALQADILERVRRGAITDEIHYQNTITIRSASGEWSDLAPGVQMKRLHRDGDARTFLLRLNAGAVLPMHHHEGDEECMVLEGEVFLGDLRVAAGDYHLARRGTPHAPIRSPRGALLFIRSTSGVPYPS